MLRARRASARRLAPTGRPILLAIALLVAACQTAFPRERTPRPALSPELKASIKEVSADLGALVLIGFAGTEVSGNQDLEELLCRVKVGGIILFARNITDADQVARLTREASAMSRGCTGRSLLIATDAEGGQVMRLGPNAGYTPTLSHQDLGDGNDLAVTELEARRIGRMLHEAGINWNLAPVVDVGYNPANPVIVRFARSFGAGPVQVTNHARAYIRGMHQEGILTALKHFPGHGSSFADSHFGFVDVTETANREVELLPYRTLHAEGLADTIMTAHVFNRRLDSRYPATLSSKTIRRLLRQGLGFDGVVVSDDLRMGAIEKHYGLGEAAVLAMRADVDLLLIATDRLPDGSSAAQTAVRALRTALAAGRLDVKRVAIALGRIDALRARLGSSRVRD
jgi:beta-N-acetylhexosaminidase